MRHLSKHNYSTNFWKYSFGESLSVRHSSICFTKPCKSVNFRFSYLRRITERPHDPRKSQRSGYSLEWFWTVGADKRQWRGTFQRCCSLERQTFTEKRRRARREKERPLLNDRAESNIQSSRVTGELSQGYAVPGEPPCARHIICVIRACVFHLWLNQSARSACVQIQAIDQSTQHN